MEVILTSSKSTVCIQSHERCSLKTVPVIFCRSKITQLATKIVLSNFVHRESCGFLKGLKFDNLSLKTDCFL